jgi:intracellular sulfur oxidation DsrE/DsrF family protein
MTHDNWARRSLLSGLGAAVAAVALGSRTARGQTRSSTPTPAGRFQPTRHEQDAWLNQVPGKHRTFIDCATVGGAGEGVLYANNLYVANKSGYQLTESDLAIVVCMRHFATVFAYNDAIWGKYGKAISDLVQFTDPKTKQAPSTNLLNSADYGMTMSNLGNTIPSVVKRGTQFAVCDMATQFFSAQVAAVVKANPQELYKEFVANLIPNSHMVAAGVVAVNRSQEYGYTLLTAL